MKPSIVFTLLALALIGLVVYSGMHREAAPEAAPAASLYPPGREPMVLPQNYRDNLVLYARVDRSDAITRNIYITPAALDAVRSGEPFPERTQIVVEAFYAARDSAGNILTDANGHLIPGEFDPEVHVAEARSTWLIEDLAASSHVGDWNFAAFELGDRNAQPRRTQRLL